MRLALIWVGRVHRKSPEQELCERYQTRLSPFVKWEETIVRGITGSNSLAEVQRRESEKIIQALQPQDYVVLCDSRGKHLSSPDLAEQLSILEQRAIKRVVFVIGGAMGVDDSFRKRADLVLSLSAMTLTHALARVVLMEQLYRAWCIKAGHPYHHEG